MEEQGGGSSAGDLSPLQGTSAERATIERLREALEVARHELVTLHGLKAADGAAPEETWDIDTSGAVAAIDGALNEAA